MKRLFLSIFLGNYLHHSLIPMISEWRTRELKDWPIRWVKLDNIHVTLAFLGEVSGKDEEKLRKGLLSLVGFGSIKIEINGLSFLGKSNFPRILFVRADSDKLMILADKIRSILKYNKLYFDKKKFNSHATIGRFKNSSPRMSVQGLKTFIAKYQKRYWGEIVVDKIELCQSIISSEGAKYKIIHEIDLQDYHEED